MYIHAYIYKLVAACMEYQYVILISLSAVAEGRGQARGEVGVAAIDLRRPHLSLAQFSDTHTYTRTLTKLIVLNPLEVSLPVLFLVRQVSTSGP